MYRCSTCLKLSLLVVTVLLTYNVGKIFNHDSQLFTTYTSNSPSRIDQSRRAVENQAEVSKELAEKLRNASWEDSIAVEGLKVTYASLDGCVKPTYHDQYKALCYTQPIARRGARIGEVRCTPNHYLLGIRKCGTTDVIKWFQYHTEKTKVLVKGDRLTPAIKCPQDLLKKGSQVMYSQDSDLMSYSPGEILFSRVKTRNDTHLVLETTLQYVAFLSVPNKSKFLLTLRNPTDRLISYLYHAHAQKWIYRSVSTARFNGAFIHNRVVELVAKVLECLETFGELACVYMYDSTDGNLQAVVQHGFYIVYMTEMFKFIPRADVYINHLEEYSKNQLVEAAKIMKFFEKELIVTDNEIETSKKQMNTGTTRNVLPKTIELLNDLYRPFNRRLAILLADDKWLYSDSGLTN